MMRSTRDGDEVMVLFVLVYCEIEIRSKLRLKLSLYIIVMNKSPFCLKWS